MDKLMIALAVLAILVAAFVSNYWVISWVADRQIGAAIDQNPPLQTHLVEVDHPKWLEAYDCNDLEVMQTYNIALIRTHLARTMAKVAVLEDPNSLGK